MDRGTKDRRLRTEGPTAETGFLGEGQRAPAHQPVSLGRAVSCPSGVWCGDSAGIEFGAFRLKKKLAIMLLS